MCLAVIGKIISIREDEGIVEISGVRREVMLSLVPGVKVGDYVMIHAGFAIQILEEEDARETIRMINEMLKETDQSGC
ncbi:MAG: HypC/HybG/HupF family hydrogenase formation chaperone [candidate division WOR-3 bacterium]